MANDAQSGALDPLPEEMQASLRTFGAYADLDPVALVAAGSFFVMAHHGSRLSGIAVGVTHFATNGDVFMPLPDLPGNVLVRFPAHRLAEALADYTARTDSDFNNLPTTEEGTS